MDTQEWFYEGFLEFSDDFQMAREEGKSLAILFEQAGCPYCRRLHEENFQKEAIINYAKDHFVFVQIDLWGSREVMDFDSEILEERALARKWGANFTPTISFFPHDMAFDPEAGKDGRSLEKTRLFGYQKPFTFLAMLEFTHEGLWKEQNFQRYLQNKLDHYRQEGKSTDI